MENIVNTATTKAVTTPRSASLETVPESRSGRFSQILNQVTTQVADKPAPVASATPGKQTQPRSTFFMNSMSLEQRKSVIDEKGFLPKPAAMESIAAPQHRH
ncbi:hypothetical protein K0038_00957 [Pseudomonas syringae]|uniref:hypothetical protein n=1 Tax=Pseudomonas syringae TaxID=317 RepID=UPI001CA8BEF1|nr:hypothetical protein [Pseudomonas syringae]MCI3943952.1 hypothetical protein [Pseudomonas syringae]